jgi:hypothetical protein
VAHVRKLIVSNFLTLDGYYESTAKTFDRFFDYFHEDYGANEAFEEYNTELLRDADTLILSGRTSFMTNKDYWVSYPDIPDGTAIRREFAESSAARRSTSSQTPSTRRTWSRGRTPPTSFEARTCTHTSQRSRRGPAATYCFS